MHANGDIFMAQSFHVLQLFQFRFRQFVFPHPECLKMVFREGTLQLARFSRRNNFAIGIIKNKNIFFYIL
jgi:hypothetical protein